MMRELILQRCLQMILEARRDFFVVLVNLHRGRVARKAWIDRSNERTNGLALLGIVISWKKDQLNYFSFVLRNQN